MNNIQIYLQTQMETFSVVHFNMPLHISGVSKSNHVWDKCITLNFNLKWPTFAYVNSRKKNTLKFSIYTGCPRRKGQNFGRVFLMLKYTDITQNTYVRSWTVTEIMAREVWNFDSCYTLIDYQIHIKTGRNMWFL